MKGLPEFAPSDWNVLVARASGALGSQRLWKIYENVGHGAGREQRPGQADSSPLCSQRQALELGVLLQHLSSFPAHDANIANALSGLSYMMITRGLIRQRVFDSPSITPQDANCRCSESLECGLLKYAVSLSICLPCWMASKSRTRLLRGRA